MRESGILMHITSLPGPYGIGTMGKEAYAFVDFLWKAGQSDWQILPLTPTGYGDSPYQSFSACAGNHYLIDLDTLAAEGLLKKKEIRDIPWGDNPQRVNFGAMYAHRMGVLKLACQRFRPDADYAAFVEENADWLPDYALFMALKERFGGAPWLDWPEPLRLHEPEALEEKLVSGGDLRADPLTEKHADWAEELKARYTFTPENAGEILRLEVGNVFKTVLEHAGVYKRDAAGRAAFIRFAESV